MCNLEDIRCYLKRLNLRRRGKVIKSLKFPPFKTNKVPNYTQNDYVYFPFEFKREVEIFKDIAVCYEFLLSHYQEPYIKFLIEFLSETVNGIRDILITFL